jgi:DNA-binding MarR family transcriptional regulator
MSEEPLSPPPGLTDLGTYLTSRAGLAARRIVVDRLESTGMRVPHYGVLACLDAYGPCSQRELAARLGLDASDVVAIVDDMEADGLVERRRDPSDRRRHAVTATSAGGAAYARARRAADKAQREFFGPLDGEERVALEGMLRRVLASHDPRFSTRDR